MTNSVGDFEHNTLDKELIGTIVAAGFRVDNTKFVPYYIIDLGDNGFYSPDKSTFVRLLVVHPENVINN